MTSFRSTFRGRQIVTVAWIVVTRPPVESRIRSTPLPVVLPAAEGVPGEGPTVDLILVDADLTPPPTIQNETGLGNRLLSLEHCASAAYDGRRLLIFQ